MAYQLEGVERRGDERVAFFSSLSLSERGEVSRGRARVRSYSCAECVFFCSLFGFFARARARAFVGARCKLIHVPGRDRYLANNEKLIGERGGFWKRVGFSRGKLIEVLLIDES